MSSLSQETESTTWWTLTCIAACGAQWAHVTAPCCPRVPKPVLKARASVPTRWTGTWNSWRRWFDTRCRRGGTWPGSLQNQSRQRLENKSIQAETGKSFRLLVNVVIFRDNLLGLDFLVRILNFYFYSFASLNNSFFIFLHVVLTSQLSLILWRYIFLFLLNIYGTYWTLRYMSWCKEIPLT